MARLSASCWCLAPIPSRLLEPRLSEGEEAAPPPSVSEGDDAVPRVSRGEGESDGAGVGELEPEVMPEPSGES